MNSIWMRLVLGAMLAVSCPWSGTARAAESRDGVFIHLSHGSDDPHRVVMALNMARIMSADHPVLVYFDIKAIDVVLKNAKSISFAHFPPSAEQLAELPKHGVILMACPGCLKAAGKTPADLAPGVQVADKTKFFTFTSGRIIALDY